MAASVQIQKIAPWMERMADIMLAQPGILNYELAALMHRTHTWVSIVKNSDTWRDYWAERSKGHSDAVTGDIKSKGYAAAEIALDILHDRLENRRDVLTENTLLQIVDINMKRFAPPVQQAPQAPVMNFNLGAVTPEQLAAARERLRLGQPPMIELKPDVSEAEVKDESKT